MRIKAQQSTWTHHWIHRSYWSQVERKNRKHWHVESKFKVDISRNRTGAYRSKVVTVQPVSSACSCGRVLSIFLWPHRVSDESFSQVKKKKVCIHSTISMSSNPGNKFQKQNESLKLAIFMHNSIKCYKPC